MTDKTACVCLCVCPCECVCIFVRTLQLTFGLTVYQGLLAAPRWPLIHPQHNDSSEEQKGANHYIKTNCLRSRMNICVCMCVFVCIHEYTVYIQRCACVCMCLCMSAYVLNKGKDWRPDTSFHQGRQKNQKQMQRHISESTYRCTHVTEHTHMHTRTHTFTHGDNHVRQEKFWVDGAEQHRRCKEWSDVNNLEVAVQWT